MSDLVEASATDALLVERGHTHGDYGDQAAATQRLRDVIMAQKNWDSLSDVQKDALQMIAVKIGRITTGDPNYGDHWDDIAGYARLVSQRLASGTG